MVAGFLFTVQFLMSPVWWTLPVAYLELFEGACCAQWRNICFETSQNLLNASNIVLAFGTKTKDVFIEPLAATALVVLLCGLCPIRQIPGSQ